MNGYGGDRSIDICCCCCCSVLVVVFFFFVRLFFHSYFVCCCRCAYFVFYFLFLFFSFFCIYFSILPFFVRISACKLVFFSGTSSVTRNIYKGIITYVYFFSFFLTYTKCMEISYSFILDSYREYK